MTQATPRPWKLQEARLLTNDGAVPILDGNGKRIALVDCQAKFKRGQGWQAECEEREANAALIVQAVNSYDAMRQALEEIRETTSNGKLPITRQVYELADAALELTKGEA